MIFSHDRRVSQVSIASIQVLVIDTEGRHCTQVSFAVCFQPPPRESILLQQELRPSRPQCQITDRKRSETNHLFQHPLEMPEQAFRGFETRQRCFPNAVISNDEGTLKIPYMPTGREVVGERTYANGREVDGLTYEGGLNKVGTYSCCVRRTWGVRVYARSTVSPACVWQDLTPCSARPADKFGRVFEGTYIRDNSKGLLHWCSHHSDSLDIPQRCGRHTFVYKVILNIVKTTRST